MKFNICNHLVLFHEFVVHVDISCHHLSSKDGIMPPIGLSMILIKFIQSMTNNFNEIVA